MVKLCGSLQVKVIVVEVVDNTATSIGAGAAKIKRNLLNNKSYGNLSLKARYFFLA